MPDTSFWAVLVAAAALLSSVIMQLLSIHNSNNNTQASLRASSKNTEDTLRESSKINQATLAASLRNAQLGIQGTNLQHVIDKLTDDLSEYMSNSYFIEVAYRDAKLNKRDWPPTEDIWERLKREDLLLNRIRLRLNPLDTLDKQLLTDLDELRKMDSPVLWIDRRDQLVASVQSVFGGKWKELLQPIPSPTAGTTVLTPEQVRIPTTKLPADTAASTL